MRLIASDEGLIAALFEKTKYPARVSGVAAERHPILEQAATELDEYFNGSRRTFATPLAPEGTEFQCKVWKALGRIPYGESRSYSQLARQIGSPAAVRAVGAANGRNQIAIIVPCHRVIGSNGKLTGYAGGMETKAWLLEHECRCRQLSDKL